MDVLASPMRRSDEAVTKLRYTSCGTSLRLPAAGAATSSALADIVEDYPRPQRVAAELAPVSGFDLRSD